jgi:hypothetical protein
MSAAVLRAVWIHRSRAQMTQKREQCRVIKPLMVPSRAGSQAPNSRASPPNDHDLLSFVSGLVQIGTSRKGERLSRCSDGTSRYSSGKLVLPSPSPRAGDPTGVSFQSDSVAAATFEILVEKRLL